MRRGTIIKNLLCGSSNAKGALGELLALQGLRRYTSVTDTSKRGYCGDLRINATKTSVEIKTATVNKRGEYKVCLRKKDKYGYTDIRNSAYALIQLINHAGNIKLYLIPTIVLNEIKNMCITWDSRKYAQYVIESYKQVVSKLV